MSPAPPQRTVLLYLLLQSLRQAPQQPHCPRLPAARGAWLAVAQSWSTRMHYWLVTMPMTPSRHQGTAPPSPAPAQTAPAVVPRRRPRRTKQPSPRSSCSHSHQHVATYVCSPLLACPPTQHTPCPSLRLPAVLQGGRLPMRVLPAPRKASICARHGRSHVGPRCRRR